MKIGIVLPIEDEGRGAVPYPIVREMAQGAEAGGLDSVWVYDHLLFRFGDDPTTGLYECWTILSAIAEATRRVELGTIVLCTAFRNPAVLAKMAGTLDAISDGRLILGSAPAGTTRSSRRSASRRTTRSADSRRR